MISKDNIIKGIMLEGKSYRMVRPELRKNVPSYKDGDLTLWNVEIYPGTLVCKVQQSDFYGPMYRVSIPIDKDATIMSDREIGRHISMFLNDENKETEVNWY